jgi:Holliday junction resolvase-like predicted endonuclease
LKMEEKLFLYKRELETEWNSGWLKGKWHNEYPELFNEEDYDIAKAQGSYHFGEWAVAKYYYSHGYKVLIENYMSDDHRDKCKIIEGIIKEESKRDLIHPLGPKGRRIGEPDLFVYKDDGEYLFVEVKKGSDKVSERQRIQLENIEKEVGKVIIAKLKKLEVRKEAYDAVIIHR